MSPNRRVLACLASSILVTSVVSGTVAAHGPERATPRLNASGTQQGAGGLDRQKPPRAESATALPRADKAYPKPIKAPAALLRARSACPNTATPVECRSALRKAYAALAWSKKQRLHARTITASNLTPLEVGRVLAQRRGWIGRQWLCLAKLWSRESGWVPTKKNYAGSGAYGIPQALPGSKMASAGDDWLTNPATQIRWGMGYVDGRYGSPCAALAHSDNEGWY